MRESANPPQEVTEQELTEQNHKNLIQIREAGDHLVEKYWKGRMRYICHAYQNEVLPKERVQTLLTSTVPEAQDMRLERITQTDIDTWIERLRTRNMI